jgi:hypothetical protein
VKCHDRPKMPAKRQDARIQAQECIAPNMRGFSLRIDFNAIRNVVQRTLAATIDVISVGVRLFLSVIPSARSQSFAQALPNQLKPITSFQFAPVDRDSHFQTDKELASLVTRGRQRQKTPVSLDTKDRGVLKSLQIESSETPLLPLSTRPRN